MTDEYGIPLKKPWREVRFYEEYDEYLQPIGEPMNLMDWQAHLQSELGMARLKIRNLEEELEFAHVARRIAMGLFTKKKADNAALKESAYLADVAFQSLKEHHDFHFGKLEEELNSLQQGYLGRGDAIRLLHSWIMEDKNKIGELEAEKGVLMIEKAVLIKDLSEVRATNRALLRLLDEANAEISALLQTLPPDVEK